MMNGIRPAAGLGRIRPRMLAGRAPMPTTEGTSSSSEESSTGKGADKAPEDIGAKDFPKVEMLFEVLKTNDDAKLRRHLESKWGVGKCKETEAMIVVKSARQFEGKWLGEVDLTRLEKVVEQMTRCNSTVNVGTGSPTPTPPVNPAGSSNGNSGVTEASDNSIRPANPNTGGQGASANAGAGSMPTVGSSSSSTSSTNTVAIVAGVCILVAAILVMQYTR